MASFVDQYGFLATWLSCIILCYQLLVFLFEPNKFLLLLLVWSTLRQEPQSIGLRFAHCVLRLVAAACLFCFLLPAIIGEIGRRNNCFLGLVSGSGAGGLSTGANDILQGDSEASSQHEPERDRTHDVFISYRRQTGKHLAGSVQQHSLSQSRSLKVK